MPEILITGRRVSAPWLHSAPLKKVFAAIAAGNEEARVVGGAVRNALIGRPVTEIDLATTATPDDVIRLARAAGLGAHPTGIDHGTVTLVADEATFEVTTLRRDVATDGRHAVVAFTKAWDEDARRRDFTINALYCAEDGTLYDPIGGLDDLVRRRVRFIGDAKARIEEDYLRILRFFRFSAEYGNGELDPTSLGAACALKDGLKRLSPERVRNEVLRLLAAPKAAEIVRVMHQSGILALIIPGTPDPDCLAHLVGIEHDLGQPPDTLARLAALAVVAPSAAPELAKRLRLSNGEAARLETAAIIEPRLDPSLARNSGRAVLYDLGPESFRRAVRVAWARSGASPSDPGWRALALLPDRWKAPRAPFSGSDVLALGVPPGPAVGRILAAFEAWWIASDFPNDVPRLRDKLKELVGSGPG